MKNAAPERATTFKTIAINQESTTIYWSHPFHMIFVEIFNKSYYLAVVQSTYNSSSNISKRIHPADRCEHISEIFNETVVQLHLLRRIKYYHRPCQQRRATNLSCFYDDVHLCLCENFDDKRLANCFEFEHDMRFDCLGHNACENGARCFQDSSSCPQTSMCVCPKCFYGGKCQFRTHGFALSLSAILGHHILPNVSINNQPMIVKLSVAFSVVIVVAGCINGLFSVLTFYNKNVQKIGCGLYLLASSITALMLTVTFGLKITLLILAQVGTLKNRSFLHFQCKSIGFLLQITLHTSQWLHASVAMERLVTVMKSTNFDKKKSKLAAKFIIPSILILTTSTIIYDPIYRHLIDERDGDEQRIWCVATYPQNIHIFNRLIQAIHFSVPLGMNIISALVIVILTTRRRTALEHNRSFREHFFKQLRLHKHVLISPIILAALVLPRLIIAFVSGCMESSQESWIYLAGYFISFIPPILTFVIFVIPSKQYKCEFTDAIRTHRKRMFMLFGRL